MSQHSKYLTTNDRYNFLIDRLQTTIRYCLSQDSYGDFFKSRLKNGEYYKRPLHNVGEYLEIRFKAGFIFIEIKTTQFNMNRFLRKRYENQYQIKYSRIILEQGDNALPFQLRAHLKAGGVSISKIREMGMNAYRDYVEVCKKEAVNHIKEFFNFNLKYEPEWCLGAVEINFDIETPGELQLAKLKNIKRRFNELLHEREHSCYESGGKISKISIAPSKFTTWGAAGDKSVASLKGKNLSEKCSVKLYAKHIQVIGGINRMEITFDEYKSFKYHLGGNKISGQNDFVDKINVLAGVAYNIALPLLNVKSKYSEKQKMKMLREACRSLCGNKYWYDIYETLVNEKCIHTGGNCSNHKGMIPVVRRLVGTMFRPKKGIRGVYVINWNWLLKQRKTGPAVVRQP